MHAYLKNDIPELAATHDVDEKVDGRVEGQDAVGDVDDPLDGPVLIAISGPHVFFAAGQNLPDVRNDSGHQVKNFW